MTNRLAQTKSLYLRKHAENPIDWWYWCSEALEKAKNEDKPIFLSVGYSSCHWCTVMEGEAFSDDAIAQYLNNNFIPIKVDREERPDLDSIYMQALQMMTGQGGWPLNIFLTPEDRVPFYGGTYFPVEQRYGRPGFLDILKAVRRFYDQEKEKLNSFKNEVMTLLQNSASLPPSQTSLNQDLLHQGVETAVGITSHRGTPPSFPMIPYADMALRGTRLSYESRYNAEEITTQRGFDLALGGIYDHVGGGFHRYTVDGTWTVPHFEKMLYDNGQIVEYLANLWSHGVKEPAFKSAIAHTVQWLQREMTAPEGYFYASQDADSFTTPDATEPEEGAFYVWSYQELETLLTSEELNALQSEFTITAEGNFEGSNVLQRQSRGDLSDEAKNALNKLFNQRYGHLSSPVTTFAPATNNSEAKQTPWQGRIPPVTDTKMITAWNSLMISGLARAYAVFGERTYWHCATKAANFIWENQWVEGRFHRLNYNGRATVAAQSEDYALFIKALLDLYSSSPQQTQWLDQATQLQAEFDEYLWSVETGGYFNTANDTSDDLIVRERTYIDNATPAANGVAVANLVRLHLLTEQMDYLSSAETTLQAFSSIMVKSPQACPGLFSGLDWYLNETLVRSTSEQLQVFLSQYLPTCVYQVETALPRNAVGLVCKGLTCLEPATTQEQLLAQIRVISDQ